MELSSETLQKYVREQIRALRETSGGASTMPRLVLDYLKSMACHRAVKFGDSLTITECKAIVHKLSQCELPFQCAHGRPSVLPILKIAPEK